MDDFAPERKAGLPVVTEVKEIMQEISHTLSSTSHPDAEERRKRVFKVKTPWFGMSALVAVLVFAVGQLLVLFFADGQTNNDWPTWISPNVCLSMLNNVTTLFLTYSIVNGIAIAWWRKAMRETSITKLHKSWSFSASILSILRGISHFNVIALAALMAKVAVIDGVLFQRAIGTETRISWDDPGALQLDKHNITVYSRTKFPYTGEIGRSQDVAAETEYYFSITIMGWLSFGDGINTWDYAPASGCMGVGCVYNVTGIGFAIDCNERDIINTSIATIQESGSGNTSIFSVGWAFNRSSITMSHKWPTNDETSCPTTFTLRECELRPAIVNYTVAYTNFSSVARGQKSSTPAMNSNYAYGYSGSSSSGSNVGASGSQLSYDCYPYATPWLGYFNYSSGCGSAYDSTQRQIKGVNVIKELDINDSEKVGSPSKLVGIFNALRDQFAANADLHYENASWSVAQTGSLAPVAMGPSPNESSHCNYTYDDQTDYILKRLNTLMLQASIDSSLTPEEDAQLVDIHGYQFYKDVYYTIDFKFAYIAIGLTVLVVLCVLPAYWQFWVLGREVTLGPLEIANAFRGPMFVEEQSGHDDFEKILKAVGHKKLRYQPATEPGQQPGFHTLP